MDGDIRLCPAGPPSPPPDEGQLAIRPLPELEGQGWVRRHLADPARARESVELYESLGFEVKLRKLTPEDFGPHCKDCASVVCLSYQMVYTRKPDTHADTGERGDAHPAA